MTQQAVAPKTGKEQVDRLGTGSIKKMMLEFAIPAMAGVIVNGLYNVIDTIFLGHGVGELGIAATTVAMPTMTILLAFSMFVGVGGNSLAALRLGEGKLKEAEKVLGNSFTLLFIFGIIVALIGLFAIDPLLTISGVTEEARPYSKSFLQIICCGFILQGIGMGINNFIRTAGRPNRALGTMVIGAVVCIILNYLFVIVFKWGVTGSALATIIGQAASAVSVIYYFVGGGAPFKLRRSNLRLDFWISRTILALGLASFLLQTAAAIVSVVLNNMLTLYGSESTIGAEGALAALGVVSKVALFVIFPVVGLAQGAQPLLGYNYGARNYRRVKKTLRTSILWASGLVCLFALIVQLFPAAIISLFGIEDALKDFAIKALRVYLLALPIIGAQIAGSQYFQATGQPAKSATLSLTRQLLFLIPLMIIFPRVLPVWFPQIDSVMAICYASPVADAVAVFVTAVFVVLEWRRLNGLLLQQEKELSA